MPAAMLLATISALMSVPWMMAEDQHEPDYDGQTRIWAGTVDREDPSGPSFFLWDSSEKEDIFPVLLSWFCLGSPHGVVWLFLCIPEEGSELRRFVKQTYGA